MYLTHSPLLGPTTPYASVKHGDFQYVGYVPCYLYAINRIESSSPREAKFVVRYTGVWNILDYSAISFPTGLTADKEIDILESCQKTLGDLDAVIQSKCQSNF
jgi:amidase